MLKLWIKEKTKTKKTQRLSRSSPCRHGPQPNQHIVISVIRSKTRGLSLINAHTQRHTRTGSWRATVLMRAFLQPPLHFMWLIETEKQTEQVWNTKYDRHTHAQPFMLALPCKAKQLIMTGAQVALQPPDFWRLGTHPARNDPAEVNVNRRKENKCQKCD